MRRRRFLPLSPGLLLGLLAIAPAGLALPDSLDETARQQAITSDSISIPTPGELFAAIEKVAEPNWPGMIGERVPQSYTNRAQIALNIGTYVADGFIAVQAEDSQQVKNIGRDIIALAKGLGVSEDLLSRGDSISDFAENNDWNGLNEELEATQNDVKIALARHKDNNLIVLVTLGGWIRGAEAASRWIKENYAPDSAALLRQPGVVDFLISQSQSLPERMRTGALLLQIKDGLARIRPLLDVPPGESLSEEQVAELNERLAGLISIIAAAPEKPKEQP